MRLIITFNGILEINDYVYISSLNKKQNTPLQPFLIQNKKLPQSQPFYSLIPPLRYILHANINSGHPDIRSFSFFRENLSISRNKIILQKKQQRGYSKY